MPRRRPLWQQAGRQLLVVFVGVYAAFALNTWQENQRDQARQRQILHALRSHVAWVHTDVQRMQPGVEAELAAFFEQLEAGEMPEIEPIQLSGGEIGSGLWEALLQSGGLDVLNTGTIELMHKYFGALKYGADRLEDARAQTRFQLYPDLGRGPSAFYNVSTGTLRPEYGWYPEALRQMRSSFRTIESLGGSVLVHLDSLLGDVPADAL